MPREIDLGYTGTRDGMTNGQRASFRRLARKFYGRFHEGDAIGGDAEAAEIIDSIDGYFIIIHPPTNTKYRANFIPKNSDYEIRKEKLYGERDFDIVQESDAMVAAPKGFKEIKRGSGTWLTIRMTRAASRPLALIWPDGNITYERWPRYFPKVGD